MSACEDIASKIIKSTPASDVYKRQGGERPEGSGVYYSYLRDLDGNKICAFTNSKE